MTFRGWLDRAYILTFGPTDPVRLDLFTRCLTLVLFVYTLDRSLTPYEWLTARGFHVSAENELVFLPTPFPLLPEVLVLPFLVIYLGCILGVVLGWQARKLLPVVLACLIYVSFADPDAAFSLNKIFVASITILLLRPPRKRAEGVLGGGAVESAWVLRALQAQIIIHYFMAGVCKVFHGDWLVDGGLIVGGDWSHWAGPSQWFAGRQDDVLWTHVVGVYRTEFAAWLLSVLPKWAWTWMQQSALIFELAAPLLFTVRRLRPVGIFWGVGFHLTIAACMYKVGMFNLQMICFFVLFVSPALLHRLGKGARRLVPASIAARMQPTSS